MDETIKFKILGIVTDDCCLYVSDNVPKCFWNAVEPIDADYYSKPNTIEPINVARVSKLPHLLDDP